MNIILPNNYSSYNDHIHGKKVEEQGTPEFITKAFETLAAGSKSQFVHSLQKHDDLSHARSVLAPHVFTQLEAGYENKWFSTREQVDHILKKATSLLAENPNGPKAASLKKIIDRARKNIEKLNNGEHVSLPSFYHSTSRIDSLFGILRTSVLAQDAVYGKGAYFSSKPEKEYGDYVIAVDVNDVYDIPLAQ